MFRQEVIDRRTSPEELNQLLAVTQPRAWSILVGVGGLILAALLWAAFTTVATQVPARGVLVPSKAGSGSLDAVVYIGLRDSPRLAPGMAVEIAPADVRRQEAGVLLGTVREVGGTPATSAALQQVVGNDAFAQMLIAQGQLVPVRVALTPDAANPTGYRWSMAGQSAIRLQAGMFCDAQITIQSQRLISLNIP